GISGIGAEKPDGRQEVAPGMGTDAEASAPAAGRSQTVGELLEKLRDAGLAPPDLAKRAAEVLKGFRPEAATVEAETRGRMVAGLAAAGAWAASMCFIAFVSALLGRDFANIAMLGIGWMIGAILLQRFAGPQSVFFRQVSLACMIAGHLMILAAAPDVLCEIGEGRRIEEVYPAAVVAALLAAIFYPLYGCAFYRFFSIACTITLLAVAAVYESRLEDVNWERIWIWHIMVVASAVCAGAVFLIPRISRRALLPAAYSCAAAMPTLLGIMTVVPFLDKKVSAPLWPSAILLGVLLVAFSCAAARRFPTGGEAGRWRGAAFSHPLKAATAALIVAAGLAVLQLPGATAAVGLLLLGFYAGDCIVMAIGFASLPFFVGCYYYSLSLDLMEKSLLLIANGILMILLYFTAGRLQGRPAWREA
ncbi:MAG: DUF4401 domain-containing protein, partial [Planctomycetota bacterium]|nr:DUF4401 domain-containing protein [Planctomycetota bacterium]